jgi:ATP-dependent Clp protease ATP-binding subunit ClpA
VFGQDLAIEKLASAIKLSRAGLRDPDKPIGNYLFSARPASARPRSRASSPR